MFIWKAEQAMAEFKRQQPEMYEQFHRTCSRQSITHEFEAKLEEVWEKIKKISIDYAVMENAENMAVIPG